MTTNKQIVIDFSETCVVDARFLGLLLMLRKQLKARNTVLRFTGISRRLERMFRLNGCGYLLSVKSKKQLQAGIAVPRLVGVSRRVERLFRLRYHR